MDPRHTLSENTSENDRRKNELRLFFQIQLERIRYKPAAHASGSKKPNLTQQDFGKGK